MAQPAFPPPPIDTAPFEDRKIFSAPWQRWYLALVRFIQTAVVTITGIPVIGSLVVFSGATSIASGDLTGDVTTSGSTATTLSNTGVTAGTYGDSSHVGQFTVNAKGRLTAAANVAIPASGITQLTGDVTAGPGSGSQVATIPNNTVTYAKMQDISAASRLLGRGSASGAGDPQEISLGSNLTMTGTVLDAVATTDHVVLSDGGIPTATPVNDGAGNFIYIPYVP